MREGPLALALVAIALGLVAIALSACGGSDDESGASPDGGSGAAAPVEVDITAPENGERIVAKERVGSRLIARVPVEGRTDVGATLIVQTSCEEAECRQSFTTDTSGRFSELVTVWSRKSGRNGYVIVGAAGSAPADRARVVVLLRPPASSGGDDERAELPKPKPDAQRTTEPEAEPTQTPPPSAPAAPETAPPTTGGGARALVMIGDSLAQGTEPYLGGLLGGWQVTTDARRGRPLAEGMEVLDGTQVPSGPVVLAFSLFTNDAPGNGAALEAAVRKSVQRAGAHGCAVWATIVRPPLGGVSYDAVNARLNGLARDPQLRGRLIVAPWAAAVARNPGLVGGDGVHGTTAGYQERARLYADAARSCRR